MAYGVILGQTPQADIPVGGIILWSGSTSNIPTNWRLCDGSNGTPDLRGQFVIGAGGSYDVGNTGGESEHTLTVNEMPRHKHTFSGTSHRHSSSLNLESLTTSSSGDHVHTFYYNGVSNNMGQGGKVPEGTWYPMRSLSGKTESAGSHTHTITGTGSVSIRSTTATGTISNSGSGSSFNILPPYYALCYIMKIA